MFQRKRQQKKLTVRWPAQLSLSRYSRGIGPRTLSPWLRLERDGFRIQPKRSRLFVTETTNRHIEQYNAILFADHPIGLAHDYLITMSAKKLHEALFQQR